MRADLREVRAAVVEIAAGPRGPLRPRPSLVRRRSAVIVPVIDNGGQWTHREWRVLRDLGAESRIVPNATPLEELTPTASSSRAARSAWRGPMPRSAASDEWIDRVTVPVLAICVGHQFLGRHFGGRIDRGGPGVRIRRPDRRPARAPAVRGPRPEAQGLGEPQRPGASSPRRNGPSLAHSSSCPVEAMAHPSRPIWGVQFHPEVEHTEGGRDMFRHFLDALPAVTPAHPTGIMHLPPLRRPGSQWPGYARRPGSASRTWSPAPRRCRASVDPLLPKRTPDCPPERFDRLRSELEEVREAADDADRLAKLARWGEPMARAYAGLLHFALEPTTPVVVAFPVAGGEVSYAPLSRADREAEVAVQQSDDPARLLLGYVDWARKGFHFFATRKTLWCTGKSSAPAGRVRGRAAREPPVPDDGRQGPGSVRLPPPGGGRTQALPRGRAGGAPRRRSASASGARRTTGTSSRASRTAPRCPTPRGSSRSTRA